MDENEIAELVKEADEEEMPKTEDIKDYNSSISNAITKENGNKK